MKKTIKKLSLNKDIVTTLNSNAISKIVGGGESITCQSNCAYNGCPPYTGTRLCLAGSRK